MPCRILRHKWRRIWQGSAQKRQPFMPTAQTAEGITYRRLASGGMLGPRACVWSRRVRHYVSPSSLRGSAACCARAEARRAARPGRPLSSPQRPLGGSAPPPLCLRLRRSPHPRAARLSRLGPGPGLVGLPVGPGAPVLGARGRWPVSSLGFRPAPPGALACGPSALPRCCVPRPGFPPTSLPSLSAPPGLRGKREASGLGLRPVPSGLPSCVFPWPVRQPCRASPASRVRLCAPGAHLVQGKALTFSPFCGTLSMRGLFRSFGGFLERGIHGRQKTARSKDRAVFLCSRAAQLLPHFGGSDFGQVNQISPTRPGPFRPSGLSRNCQPRIFPYCQKHISPRCPALVFHLMLKHPGGKTTRFPR